MEDEGVPTTQISLIRPHTEGIRPPRALWVPFELGRPFGAPNRPDFQTRVLIAALKLLEQDTGPVLEDFEEEAPVVETEPVQIACPVSFTDPAPQETTGQLIEALKSEVEHLRTWYDLAMEKGRRTTVGVSDMGLGEIADFISAFVCPEPPEPPNPDMPVHQALRLAVNDLKAFYTEAALMQPGCMNVTSEQLNNWFWEETAAAKLLRAIRDAADGFEDEDLKYTARVNLVPRLKS